MAGKDVRKGVGTPADRRPSKQEEIKDLDILWTKIKEEFKQNEQHMEKKLGEMQETLDKKIEGAVGELSTKIKDLTVKSKNMEESMKKTQKEVKESKKETDRIKEEVTELNKAQEQMWDNMAMMEMRQKQMNLKFRGVAEETNEDIKAKMIQELANWMDMKEEEIGYTIVNAFRIKVRSAKAKAKKFPGDCLVIFNSLEMRNAILRRSYTNKLIIDGRPIIIFKEIPARFLRKREGYQQVVTLLKLNGIQYRWEFPEGISFYYKDKRFRLTDSLEVKKFTRRYEKELGKVDTNVPGPAGPLGGGMGEEPKEKRKKKGKKKGEEREEEEEKEEESQDEEEEEEEEEEDIDNKDTQL